VRLRLTRAVKGEDNEDVCGYVLPTYLLRPCTSRCHTERRRGRSNGWWRVNQAPTANWFLRIGQHGSVGQTHAIGLDGPHSQIWQQAPQHVGGLSPTHGLARSQAFSAQ